MRHSRGVTKQETRRVETPVRPKPRVVVAGDMKLSLTETLTNPQGLFDVVIGGIVLLAALFLAVLLLFGSF